MIPNSTLSRSSAKVPNSLSQTMNIPHSFCPGTADSYHGARDDERGVLNTASIGLGNLPINCVCNGVWYSWTSASEKKINKGLNPRIARGIENNTG